RPPTLTLFPYTTLFRSTAPTSVKYARGYLAKERPVKLDVGMLTHDLKSIPGYARKVEAMGYDCLWSSETQHDPFLPLAVAATVRSEEHTSELQSLAYLV